MPDTQQDTVEPRANGDSEEHLPWYKRSAVIVALIGALVALTGTIIKVVIPKVWPEKSTNISVRGRVSDSQARPLGGAKVSLEGKGLPPLIYTDSEGIFSFYLPDDVREIKIRVEASGYDSYNRRVDVLAKNELEDIRLRPQPKPETEAELSGTVLDGAGRPLQGARVTLDDFPGMPPTETSSDGVFNLRNIPKKYGEGVRVRVVMQDYLPNPYTEDVVLGKAPPVITLKRSR